VLPASGILLASASPRRRELLALAGIECAVAEPPIDDGALPARPGRVEHQATGMAWFKARQVADSARAGGARAGFVVGADTMCEHRGRALGKPRDVAEARAQLSSFIGTSHRVVTALCVIDLASGRRRTAVDAAEVRFGQVAPGALEEYLASGSWRGKAGSYNLPERVGAGWPIECVGDPQTVVGLPVRLLRRELSCLGWRP
jgi:MAF protein